MNTTLTTTLSLLLSTFGTLSPEQIRADIKSLGIAEPTNTEIAKAAREIGAHIGPVSGMISLGNIGNYDRLIQLERLSFEFHRLGSAAWAAKRAKLIRGWMRADARSAERMAA